MNYLFAIPAACIVIAAFLVVWSAIRGSAKTNL
jgi:hypothetical protein